MHCFLTLVRSCGKSNLEVRFALNMLSALIDSALSYPAVLLVEQPAHQRCVQLGPLVTLLLYF